MGQTNNTPVGYVILDRSGFIQEANETFARLVGSDLGAVAGKPFTNYLSDAACHIFLSQYKAFFKDPDNKQLVISIHQARRGARTPKLFGRKEPLADGGASLPGDKIRVVAIDITDQRKAEEKAQASHEALRLQHDIQGSDLPAEAPDPGRHSD